MAGRPSPHSLHPEFSEHIAPLQDAVDLEIATEENSLLEARKKYRVLLNRVNTTTAPDIEWPTSTHYRIVHYELQDIIWDNILQFIGTVF